MSFDLILALAGFAFVTSVTPGPNNLLLLASGLNFGYRRSIPHMLGVGIGFMVMLGLVGLGIGQVLLATPALDLALKVASMAYVLWLAWKIANAAPPEADEMAEAGRPMTFLQAAAFQWVNPKAWAVALAATAAYMLPVDNYASLLAMVVVFGLVNFPSISVWTGFGLMMRRLLRRPGWVRTFNIAMAVLLVFSMLPVLFGVVD